MNQECIPVECVPSAAVAISGGGVCLGGVCLEGVCPGGCLPGNISPGGSLPRGYLPGVSDQGKCVFPGVSAQGSLPGWGVCHPPVNRITDACENITFPDGKNNNLQFLFKIKHNTYNFRIFGTVLCININW